jgi:outer membrane cobalamin receptor
MLLLKSRAAWPQVAGSVLFVFWVSLGVVFGQDALTPPETSELVVSATRIPTSEDETPASVTVITADDFSIHQTERVADALRVRAGALGCAKRDGRATHVRFHPRSAQ